MNPLQKLHEEQGVTFAHMSRKTGFSKVYIGQIAKYDPSELRKCSLALLLKLEEGIGVNIIDPLINR